jgi:hypothetical protein
MLCRNSSRLPLADLGRQIGQHRDRGLGVLAGGRVEQEELLL